MIGQHDDVVRAVRGLGGVRYAPERPVDPAQHVERVVALDAGVVCDLVVADERGVDDGAARVGVGDDGLDGDVAEDHDGDGAQQRVADATVHARDDVPADLLRRRVQLAADVEQAEHEGAKD